MDKSKFPAPGDLVDVGSHRLHIYGIGEGSPTVVLDSEYNGSWLDWSWVQPEVAKFTRVVSYDRAGLGWSDPAKPRSIQRIVNELHRLLANAGVGGPYVMVGQSSGGMNVRVYASQHPQDVVGMVLVNAAHEDWPEIKLQAPSRGRLLEDLREQMLQLYPILARLGVLRLRRKPNGPVLALPPNIQPIAMALGLRSRAYDWVWGAKTEIQLSESQIRDSSPLPEIPLAVLSAHIRGEPWGIPAHEADSYWMALQEDLANLVPNSTHTVSEHGGHNLHVDDPDLVIDAIRQVV
jgi:pimeloyl-ACP methyl ester carboxylesterase